MFFSRTASIAEQNRQRQRWHALRQQYRIGFDHGRMGLRYQPYATRFFNHGYWNGFVEGRARRNKLEQRQ